MSRRRILVIGSQCSALGYLSFLPSVALDLYGVMTDPGRGDCVSALEGAGVLIDPTVNEAKDAIRRAYQRAARDEATLFIAYIGHGEKVGEKVGEDFFLMPQDAKSPPTSDTAIHFTHLIKEIHNTSPGRVDGLGVLVDTCFAGVAGFSAAKTWIADLKGTLRFEMLAAVDHRPAANGCFSRSLIALLRDGIAMIPSAYLWCSDVRPYIERDCPNQVPQHPSYNPDKTLWLARNGGVLNEFWSHTEVAEEIQRLTLAYQPTPALSDTVLNSIQYSCLALVGEAGSGKSALAAALAWPRVTADIVPNGFVHAIALLTEATTPHGLARMLAAQLSRSVARFREAQEHFARDSALSQRQRLGILERLVVGPLNLLQTGESIRLIVDGLDRIAVGAQASIMGALELLTRLTFVNLVITARPDTELPKTAHPYQLPAASADSVSRYLQRRDIPQSRIDSITRAAQGNWLVARSIVDLLSQDPNAKICSDFVVLNELFEEMLVRCGATENDNTQNILAILGAAGSGPIVPMDLLCTASEILAGPGTPAGVRDHLVRLRGLVVRIGAGTMLEHVGLFHQTLNKYVTTSSPQKNREAHYAIVTAIQQLSPLGKGPTDLDDPITSYAFEREAEHLWFLGDFAMAIRCLTLRTSANPRDNVRRWERWKTFIESTQGPDHPEALAAESNIAHWTADCGDFEKALQIASALLPRMTQVLGPNHLYTLVTRHNIASFTGEIWNARKALELSKSLLIDETHVLGPYHWETLSTRGNVAYFTGALDNVQEALQLMETLLTDQRHVMGPDDQKTLSTRLNIANLTARSGNNQKALKLLRELIPDLERVCGPGARNTLKARTAAILLDSSSHTGNQLKSLLHDLDHYLGSDDRDTLVFRVNIASIKLAGGNARGALELAETLLPELKHQFGPNHLETLRLRRLIASCVGEDGDKQRALALCLELLPMEIAALGPTHQETLLTRFSIADWTLRSGDPQEALRLFSDLYNDQKDVLAPDDPEILMTRLCVGQATGACGDVSKAMSLFRALVLDQTRILGWDHPNTLKTRSNIGFLTAGSGNVREALRLAREVLHDRVRVLGRNHPSTLKTLADVIGYTHGLSNHLDARKLFELLLVDQVNILGKLHRETLATRLYMLLFSQRSGKV